ncbi:DUF4873 domain-containing protein [Mycolicibacterium sp. 120270]|uniref:DUF4873 domain-containing protein n=1 Tax=Mycolicibacterium sp. 120270 TaxID=3090600 RepID=UPI00299D5129|nr:DUF4873 domain-containing protein [Mycolicibacterium sp. 120270]MDX1885136.1 DUF4873 domain-containing protein [Mycolicibacterium sp. 120270]
MTVHDVAVVGVERAEHRLGDIAVLHDVDLTDAVFDEATHTWMLPTARARILVTDQIRSGRDDLAPYLGVAVHGAPNYFMVTGADDVAEAQLDYIAECLRLMRRTGSTRIEVLYSTQRMFCMRGPEKADRADPPYWARMVKAVPTSFDLSSHVGVYDEVYDGLATVRIGEDERSVRVRLSGRLDPIDGRYHWQGTIFGVLPDAATSSAVTVTIGEQSAQGRISERTQQGGCSVAGAGTPPYELDDVEVVVPLR